MPAPGLGPSPGRPRASPALARGRASPEDRRTGPYADDMDARQAPTASVQDVTDIIDAVGAIAWPLVFVLFMVLFRRPIRGVLARLENLKLPGVEVGLRMELDALQATTEQAAESVAGAPEDPGEQAAANRVENEVLDEAQQRPKLALMSLSAELDRLSREILAGSQDPAAWEGRSLTEKLRRISLSPHVHAAAMQFMHVRSRIVHGHAATDDDALRAIDLGLTILDALRHVPHEVHYVREPKATVFLDAAGQRPAPDFHAVVLESATPQGPKVRVFPTTRDHFRAGKAVAWEWSQQGFPAAWWWDPGDDELKKAWDSSAEFIGRHLDEI